MNRIYKCRLLRSICSFLLLILISYNAFGNNSTHTQSKEVIKDNLVSNNSSNHEAKLFNKVAIYTLYTDPDDKVNPSKIYQTQFNVESKILFQYQPPYFYTMGNEPQVIPTIAYDPSGKYLFAGGYSRGINFKNQMTTYEIYPRGVLYQTITNTHTTVGDKPTVGKIIIDPKGRYLYQFYKYQSGQQVIDTYIIRYGGGIEFTNNSTPLENIAKYDMAITPNGKYAYVTNPEINQISIYTIDDYIGKLQKIASVNSGGYTPHNIVIEPNGKYLYVYNSAITGSSPRNLTVFKINDNNGYLIPVHSVVLQNSATDVVVDPKTGDYLYVSMGRVITTYSISKDTGELRQTAVFNMDPSVGSISAMAIDNSGSFISVVDSLCKSHLYVLGIDKVNGGKLSLIASKYLSSKCLLEEDSYPTVNIMKDISSIDFQKSLAGINDENTFKSFLSNSRFFHTLNYSRPLPNVVELQNYNLKILDWTNATPTIILKKREPLYEGKTIIINNTDVYQDIGSILFTKQFTRRISTTTTLGWSFNTTIKGILKIFNITTGFNGSTESASESSVSDSYSTPQSAFKLGPKSYAVIEINIFTVSATGKYKFSIKATGAMSVIYKTPDGIIGSTPLDSIRYHLRAYYYLDYFPGLIYFNENATDRDIFYLEGLGNYMVQTGSDGTTKVSNCSKDSTKPPCDPKYYNYSPGRHPNNFIVFNAGNVPESVDLDGNY